MAAKDVATHMQDRANSFARNFLRKRSETLPPEPMPPVTGDVGLAQTMAEIRKAHERIKKVRS